MLTALALTAAVAACDWSEPGRQRYTGDTVAAARSYGISDALAARIERHDYDERVVITRDAISGMATYEPQLTDMHFGTGRRCATVSRAGWKPGHTEEALVYCEGNACVAVPSVCGNVSRVTRRAPPAALLEPPVETFAGGGGPIGWAPLLPALPAVLPPRVVEAYGPPLVWVPALPPVFSYNPPPAAPVSEPPVWALLLGGLLAAVWRAVTRRAG